MKCIYNEIWHYQVTENIPNKNLCLHKSLSKIEITLLHKDLAKFYDFISW